MIPIRPIALILLIAALFTGCHSPPSVGEVPYQGPATRDDGTPVPAPTGGIR